MVTIRPDSGDAITNILFALESLEKNFGYTINSKGYKVINKVRILQGDGINEDTIWDIYKSLRITNILPKMLLWAAEDLFCKEMKNLALTGILINLP